MNVGPETHRGIGPSSSMERTSVPSAHQQHEVPQAIRSFSTMADPDYVDLFTLETSDAGGWSPEQWARAMFEDVAGEQGQRVWRELLGLRLERPGSPGCVAGWRIADRGDSWVRVEASSSFLTAHLVIQIGDGQVSFATFMQYDGPEGARIWTPASPRHRGAAPSLLEQAYHFLQSRPC
ncbi:hypothetical protein AB0D04_04310 [Streptomyces sp. NPDC048483]|uniref:hypothetical protein n=1 Tax=Streptomyces sp. NPDC048483 TaxID=3154927 RepID=UPI003440E3F0